LPLQCKNASQQQQQEQPDGTTTTTVTVTVTVGKIKFLRRCIGKGKDTKVVVIVVVAARRGQIKIALQTE